VRIFIENCLPAAEYFTTMTVAFLQGVTYMTSNFMRTVHLKTAQQFKEQGHDVQYVVKHFHKVGIPEDEIPELLPLLGFSLDADPLALPNKGRKD
jgi:hypothetical protein